MHGCVHPVSYTHLDVYKRQGFYAGRTHNIIENRDCALGVAENKEVLDRVIAHMEKYLSLIHIFTDLFFGLIDDIVRKSKLGRNGECITFPGNTDQQAVGRAERFHVKFAAGIFLSLIHISAGY